jgi:hypothetical protein
MILRGIAPFRAAGKRFTEAAVALALLGGCQAPLATQPVAREGTRIAHTLRLEPHLAAVCIAANVDKHRSPYSAQIRPGVAPVLVEVQVRGARLVAVAELTAAGEGSHAVIWMSPEPVYEWEALVAAMVEGC